MSPIRDTLSIGDTITIESVFSSLVYEQKTEKRYELEDWGFYPITTIVRIDTNPADRGAFESFDVVIDSTYDYYPFISSSGLSAYRGAYRYVDYQYDLKLKVTPLQEGLYCIAQGSWLFDFGADQSFDGKCRSIGSEAVVLHEQPDEMNIHFMMNSPDPYYNNWILQRPQERFHDAGGYCFYVVE